MIQKVGSAARLRRRHVAFPLNLVGPEHLRVAGMFGLDGILFEPLVQMQEFPDLSSLMSVAELFLRLERGFMEGMFGVLNDFTHRFEILGHDLTPFTVLNSENDAIP